ncbi:MerR family transcriptional regulator [Pseudoflavonifractor sp. 60]|uniref:MerR family transcriptional regulator n=1 Tax=Pseudoflavonifractor sp. 60 TaxID=2304576 RepID=UPI00136A5A42|nr:MerR family transcriptional regulator [Pseudoflavonifractor sp. 60]NBI67128.1 MerR family transcriptional regulator [Pseudoflavonifractor sp. 60]
MDYSIGEFSKVTGLGIHTLRYYEHENLIIPLRNANNRRRYSEKDIAWIAFIKRLKATGMPIKEIKKYAALRAKGDATLSERMEMLIQHRQSLNEQIRQLQEHEAMLDEKIAFYQREIKKITDASN